MLLTSIRAVPLRLLLLLSAAVFLAACEQPADNRTRLQQALEYKAQGNYRSAMIELKNALQEAPDNARARLELGRLYVVMGEGAAAEKELLRARELGIPAEETLVYLGRALLQQQDYRRLLETLDSNAVTGSGQKANILLLRGHALLRTGELEGAEAAYRQALELDPAVAPDALTGLARIAFRKHDLEAAREQVSRALELDPEHAEAWLARGFIEKQAGDFAAAEDAFANAIRYEPPGQNVSPTLFSARIGLVQAQLSRGRTEQAAENIDWLSQVAPRHPVPLFYRALLAYGQGDFDTAATRLQEVLNIDRHYRPALKLMGAINFVQGNLEQADMYLSAFLTSVPEDLAARKLLATTRLQLQQPEYAIEALEPALQQDMADVGALALFGAAQVRAGNRDAGIEYLARALAASPDNRALQRELVTNYLMAGELGKAVDILEQAPPGEDSEDAYHRELQIILVYLQGKEFDQALERARALEQQRPDDPVLQNLLGGIMAASGQNAQARARLEKAVALDPSYQEAWLNLGRLAVRQGRMAKARAHYEHVLELNPKNIAAMMSLAQIAAAEGRQKETIQWLQRAREADSHAIDARLALVRHYLGRRNFTLALEIAEEAYAVAPDNVEVLNALGVTQMWAREQRKAVATLKQALEKAPDSVTISYNLARAQLAINETGAARKHLQKVLQLAPGNRAAATLLAALEMHEGNTEQALALARRQQQASRTDPAGYILEGDLHMQRQDFPAALRAYRTAWKLGHSRETALKLYVAEKQSGSSNPYRPLQEWLRQHPDDARVRVVLGNAFQEAGRIRDAIAQYEAALEYDPQNAMLLNNLAWSYHLDQNPRALQLAAEAHRLEPGRGDITDTYGWLLVHNGDVRRGVEILRQAVEQAPSVPMIRYHLAVALARAGAGREARQELEKVLQSDGEFQGLPEIQEIMDTAATP